MKYRSAAFAAFSCLMLLVILASCTGQQAGDPWRRVSSPGLGFEIEVPIEYEASSETEEARQIVFSTPIAQERGMPPTFFVFVDDLEPHPTLSGWVQANSGLSSDELQVVNFGANEFLEWSSALGEGQTLISYSMLNGDSEVLTITTTPAFLDIENYENVLSSFRVIE